MSNLSTSMKVLATREGGAVERCHGMPHHGSYSVGLHSYNALSLLLILHPDPGPSMALIKAVLWHDVPERWMGDIPRPAKWASPELELAERELEERLTRALDLHDGVWSDHDQQWLAAVDIVEMYIWCLDQIELGNRHAERMRGKISRLINQRTVKMPQEMIKFLENFGYQRLDDCDEFLHSSGQYEINPRLGY